MRKCVHNLNPAVCSHCITAGAPRFPPERNTRRVPPAAPLEREGREDDPPAVHVEKKPLAVKMGGASAPGLGRGVTSTVVEVEAAPAPAGKTTCQKCGGGVSPKSHTPAACAALMAARGGPKCKRCKNPNTRAAGGRLPGYCKNCFGNAKTRTRQRVGRVDITDAEIMVELEKPYSPDAVPRGPSAAQKAPAAKPETPRPGRTVEVREEIAREVNGPVEVTLTKVTTFVDPAVAVVAETAPPPPEPDDEPAQAQEEPFASQSLSDSTDEVGNTTFRRCCVEHVAPDEGDRGTVVWYSCMLPAEHPGPHEHSIGQGPARIELESLCDAVYVHIECSNHGEEWSYRCDLLSGHTGPHWHASRSLPVKITPRTAAPPIATPEPPPRNLGIEVTPPLVLWLRALPLDVAIVQELVEGVEARSAFGREKYGQPLMTGDGRDSVNDARQEGADMLQYAFKAHMNGEDVAQLVPLARAILRMVEGPTECRACGHSYAKDFGAHTFQRCLEREKERARSAASVKPDIAELGLLGAGHVTASEELRAEMDAMKAELAELRQRTEARVESTNAVEVTLPPVVLHMLDTLMISGLWGVTRSDVLERLACERLRDLAHSGLLVLK